MALSVDPFKMLAIVGENEKAFSHVRMDVRKAAKSLAEKAIRSPKVTVASLGNIADAMGKDDLALLLEGLPKAALKTMVKRLDRHNENFLKGAPEPDEIWLRKRLMALALKKAAPAGKLDKEAAAKAVSKSKKAARSSAATKRKPAKIGTRSAVHTKRKK